jgi:hypothetical protein
VTTPTTQLFDVFFNVDIAQHSGRPVSLFDAAISRVIRSFKSIAPLTAAASISDDRASV